MKVWDLHCDTLSELRYAMLGKWEYSSLKNNHQEEGELSFLENSLQVDLKRLKQGDYLLQCFACFTNLGRKLGNPLVAGHEMIDIFYGLMETYADDLVQIRTPEDIRRLPEDGRIGAMLTIEEGGVCLDSIHVLRDLYRLGVRMMTLTWNYENGLAYPNSVPGNGDVWPCMPEIDPGKGLKQKGIEFIEAMEELHMILDVSHLGDPGFWDVVRCSKRPFAASHSNARAICGHARNLDDKMIRVMGERGGLIGLNFCGDFLDPTTDRSNVKSRVSDMAVHAKHIMDVGGSEILALGSDFDGIEGDLEIASAKDMPRLAEGLEREGIPHSVVENIFWKNASRFFMENL